MANERVGFIKRALLVGDLDVFAPGQSWRTRCGHRVGKSGGPAKEADETVWSITIHTPVG